MFQTTPSCTRTKICKDCNKTIIRKLPLVSIDVNVILQNDLRCIQQSIQKAVFTHGTCQTCKTNTIETEYGPHILIDTSILTDNAYLHAINVKKKIFRLGDVQNIINIENQNYRLAGIVSYRGCGNSDHYVAYVNNIINWYKYDNMHDKRYMVTTEEVITPHVIMFVKA